MPSYLSRCEDFDVREMLIAETESEATTAGWGPDLGELPGEKSVRGTFNEHLDGLDTALKHGDPVALMYPFIYCC